MNIPQLRCLIVLAFSLIAYETYADPVKELKVNGETYEIRNRGIEITYSWSADEKFKNFAEKPYIFVTERSLWNGIKDSYLKNVYLINSPIGRIRYYVDGDRKIVNGKFDTAFISLPCEHSIRESEIRNYAPEDRNRQAYFANKANHQFQIGLKRYFADITTTEKECSVKLYEFGDAENKEYTEARLLAEDAISASDVIWSDLSIPDNDGLGLSVDVVESEPAQASKP